ncbi:MAG: tRNA (adenosine(37)-N6)-threonylcarbamoyltransferase complex dimerization subunit type 1 TsaB [Desulforhopalus sp.]|nr:tRNA (adenosine(37)-N6)-threonylcarbamoyltransferase complex dimerization subunit type 1 TsaB [Desulforhopalus sp.]
MDCQQPLILSMDTATPCSAVALTSGTRKDGRVIASLSLTGNVTHSRRLFTAIDYLMKEAAVDWTSIAGIGVSLGPGSFTGLRIGMATAKGLAAAAGKALLGVSTLDSLAAKCVTPYLICTVLDARKKEVYAAFYRCNGNGLSERVSDMTVMAPEKLACSISEPVIMVGDGAMVYRHLFKRLLREKVIFAPSQLHEPSASSLGLLAGEMLDLGEQLDVADAVPVYIRSSDAELNLLQKKAKMQKKLAK